MTEEGSISRWLDQLAHGDRLAAEQLWRRYFHRLVGLARGKLRDAPRRAADEEDVALSAFDSFCRGAEQGQFPDLADRESLWAVLVTLTARKAFRLMRDQQRQKRGGPGSGAIFTENAAWEEVLGREPSPDLAAEMAETYQRLLERLPDADLRSVAVWKMEGHGVEEMARRLNCSPRSIKRKAQLIRTLWEKEIAE
jgi:DNA-directed RNA polymerase specialized sigma24 family protein